MCMHVHTTSTYNMYNHVYTYNMYIQHVPRPQSHRVHGRGVWQERRTVRRWIQIPHRAGCYETAQKSQFGPAQTTDTSEHTRTPVS